MNTGAEGVETAIKAARRWGYKSKKIPPNKAEIIVADQNFHGRTTTIISFSSDKESKENFGPLTPGFKTVKFGCIDSLQSAITENTAAFLVEPIQGEAGIVIPDPSWLPKVRELCTEKNVLLILDEVQSGLGRTGKMFAYEHSSIRPDGLILGKALGGGMPIGAFISSYEIMNTLTHNPMLGHITTFGGHPLICAAANACLNVLKTEPWIDQAEEKGKRLALALMLNDEVLEVRQKGLFFAIEMGSFERVKLVVDKCLELGLIGFWFLSTPTAFRLSPPLSITNQEIDLATNIILKAIEETKV
jgi:acetylornithine/succinyldiaminopimelate/putrescine aminotransferase